MLRLLLAFLLMFSATEVFAQYVIPPGYHAHRTLDGKILVHRYKSGGNAEAHKNVAYPWVVIARAGQVINNTKSQPSLSIMPRFINPVVPLRIVPYRNGCPGGNCPK